MMLVNFVNAIGCRALKTISIVGKLSLFGKRTLSTFIARPLHKKQLLDQMRVIGVDSFGIVFLTGSFAGLALALQSYIGFSRVHAEQFTGLVVTLGIARELGPVLTGLMVTGRVGSAIAAELSSMSISEQIDALKTLCIDPYYYLIVPRILAATIMMPFVAIFAMIFGMASSYLLCVFVLDINAESYLSIIQENMTLKDITGGLIKSGFFGFIFAWIGSFIGYSSKGGARNVGVATTQAVVYGCILILISNYVLSSFLYSTGLS